MRINIKLSVQWVLKVTLSSCEMQKEMEVSEVCNANYAQTECQFRYCGTAIPFLTVRSTAR